MKNYWQIENGLKFFGMPFTGREKVNQMNREIIDLGYVTASEMAELTSLNTASGQLFCGKINRAFPLIRQFVRSAYGNSVVILGGGSDNLLLSFKKVFPDWLLDKPQKLLPPGEGIILVKDGESVLRIREYIQYWKRYSIVLCLGRGLLLLEDIMDNLSWCRKYMILTEQLSADVRKPLTSDEVLARVQGIYIASAGSVPKSFQNIFHDYQAEKTQNSMAFSLHNGQPPVKEKSGCHHSGKGLIISQSRSMESRHILDQSDLIFLQKTGKTVIYNMRQLRIYIALITR